MGDLADLTTARGRARNAIWLVSLPDRRDVIEARKEHALTALDKALAELQAEIDRLAAGWDGSDAVNIQGAALVRSLAAERDQAVKELRSLRAVVARVLRQGGGVAQLREHLNAMPADGWALPPEAFTDGPDPAPALRAAADRRAIALIEEAHHG